MSTAGSKSEVVLGLAEEFLERYRQGERPSLKNYIDRHPELAEEIREVFPAMAMMENIAIGDESLAGDLADTGTDAAPLALQQLGDYRIIRQVGQGGMGVVYEAEQVSLGRHVALKVLPQKLLLDAKQKRRFEREARSAAKLHHTNIVPIFGVGEQDGLPYYVMQFIQGLGLDEVLDELKRMRDGGSSPTNAELRISRKDLSAANMARSLMNGRFEETREFDAAPRDPTSDPPRSGASAPDPSTGRLSDSFTLSNSSVILPGQSGTTRSSSARKQTYWQSVATIGMQVADALEYAHKQGILHRDVKPSNLLLDTHGTVWVTDFGRAKMDDQQNLTHTGDILGTLRYMPPEAFDAKTDRRNDVYALGLTLYELLAFRPAYTEKERHKLIKQVTTEEAPALDKLNPAIPRDLVTIVRKAIERDPSHRYPTAGEFAADLHRFIEDEPIHARRISVFERSWRWCKHNPAVASLTAMVAILLVASAVGASLWAVSADNSAQREKAAAKRANDAADQAELAAEFALAKENETRKHVGEQYVAHGGRLMEQGDVTGAALLFAEALDHDQDDADRAATHRIRLAMALRQCPHPLHIFFQKDRINSARFSPDGKWIVTACENGVVQVWDAATGKPAGPALEHNKPVFLAIFSADGTRLLTVANEIKATSDPSIPPAFAGTLNPRRYEARVWEPGTGKPLTPVLEGIGGTGHPEFSPDGRFVAGTTKDGVQVWDADTGKPVSRFKAPVGRVSFSPDSRSVLMIEQYNATPGSGGAGAGFSLPPADAVEEKTIAQIGDIANGTIVELRGPMPARRAPNSRQSHGQFSPDGRCVATAVGTIGLQLWDAKTGRLLWTPPRGTRIYTNVLFSPDGKYLIGHGFRAVGDLGPSVGSANAAGVAVFDAATGRPIGEPLAGTVISGVRISASSSVQQWQPLFSPDGSRLLVPEPSGGAPRLFEIPSGRQVAQGLEHTSFVTRAAFSPDGLQVLTVGIDHSVRVWDARTSQPVTSYYPHDRATMAAEFSPDGSHILTVCGASARLWPLAPAAPERQVVKLDRAASSVQISPDGRRILLLFPGTKAEARILDAASRKLIGDPITIDGFNVMGDFSPDGRHVLFTDVRRGVVPGNLLSTKIDSVRLLAVETGKLVNLDIPRDNQEGQAIVSGDGRFVRTLIYLPKEQPPAADPAPVRLNLLPVEARLWDIGTGQAAGPASRFRVAALRPFGGAMHRLPTEGPDARLMVAVDPVEGGFQLRIWDLLKGAPVGPALGDEPWKTLPGIFFSLDGRRVLTSGSSASPASLLSGLERVWDVETDRPLTPVLTFRNSVESGNFAPVALIRDWSPDGERLLVTKVEAGGGGQAEVWGLAENKPIGPPLEHDGQVGNARFSPDGKWVVTASSDGTCRVWDPVTGEGRTPMRCDGITPNVWFSRDGRRVLTSSIDRTSLTPLSPTVRELRVWDAATGQPLTTALKSPTSFRNPGPGAGPQGAGFNSPLYDTTMVSADGDRIIFLENEQLTILDLSADPRPSGDLLQLAQTLACRRVNTAGSVQPIQDFAQGWQDVLARRDLDMENPPARGAEWHHRRLADLGFQANGINGPLQRNINLPPAWLSSITPGLLSSITRRLDRPDANAALFHVERLIALEPDNAANYNARGVVHEFYDRLKEATDDWTEAERLGNKDAQSLRANAYARLGQFDKAAADYGKLVDQMPTNFPNRHYQACALLGAGDREGYRKACDSALEQFDKIVPNSTGPVAARRNPFNLRSCIYVPDVVDPKRLEELAKEEASLQARTVSAGSIQFRAACLLRAGKCEDALKLEEEVIRGRGDDAPKYQALDSVWLALIHAKMGHLKEAADALAQGRKAYAELKQRLAAAADKGSDDIANDPLANWEIRVEIEVLQAEAEKEVAG
jgi:WD40 repeat protein/serine/threonine protein kinase/tetratricopeptide (TPR) repeat protein